MVYTWRLKYDCRFGFLYCHTLYRYDYLQIIDAKKQIQIDIPTNRPSANSVSKSQHYGQTNR